jgi:ABC-2 type transport system ATP-binding protein
VIVIEALDIRRSFGEVLAVDGLSLSVEAGEIYALVGPDGAGKTTTLRLLCGALQPDAGQIHLAGIDLMRNTEHARAQIGYLPQRFSLYGELTVLENLRFFAEVRGLPSQRWLPRSKEILDFVGLSEFGDRRAEALSGGMKQKLGLAAALVHEPKILLLDEPTGGVDPVTRQSFWQLLIQLLRQNVAVLISTPYMDEASRCSRVGFMQNGRLMVEGTPAKIVQSLQGRVLELIGSPRRLLEQLAASDPQVQNAHAFGDCLHLRVAPDSAETVMQRLTSAALSQDAVIDQIQFVPPGLEDVFLELLEQP